MKRVITVSALLLLAGCDDAGPTAEQEGDATPDAAVARLDGALPAVDGGEPPDGLPDEDAAPPEDALPADTGPMDARAPDADRPDAAPPAEPQLDGEGCAHDRDCLGGTCLVDWPGGYCTTLDCRNFEDCARDEAHDNKCLTGRGQSFCVRICTENGHCRPGYRCEPVQPGVGVCAPDPNQPLLDDAAIDGHPFDIACVGPSRGAQFQLDYAVAPDTTAYLFTPFTRRGGPLRPTLISGPQSDIDFSGPNAFQAIPSVLFGGLNPTLVPATARFAAQRQTGPHTFVLQAEDEEVCGYLLEESAPGTRIDLNVYLVGLPGLGPAEAPRHAGLQAVLGRFEAIYGTAGVSLGTVRYRGLSPEAEARFAIIRSTADAAAVLEHTEVPGPTADDALSLNVVFTQAFAFGNTGTLGISLGLPGPAGLHGTRASGVVFTGEFIGQRFRDGAGQETDGNDYTGQILAHEVGHYLGLFHTTELNGQGQDPLDDTPRCQGVRPEQCPDVDNLMFPLARSRSADLSELQISVIRANPLTKE